MMNLQSYASLRKDCRVMFHNMHIAILIHKLTKYTSAGLVWSVFHITIYISDLPLE